MVLAGRKATKPEWQKAFPPANFLAPYIMALRIVNPLDIPNWDDLVLAAEHTSFFHSAGWAKVLHESYGYKPVYFISVENDKLSSLVPFMEINSWLTGKRGVSLPFTDECIALVSGNELFPEIVRQVEDYGRKAGWKYIEWREGDRFPENTKPSMVYYTHDLYLEREERELLSNFRDSTRRNIKKAVKSGVLVEISQSRDSVKSFYRLHNITRKRHGVPPQPYSFFKRIFDHVISKGHGIVVSASYSGKVCSSSIFFHFGREAIYKFGASDMSYQKFRPSNLVMYETIKWYRDKGFELLNFGRTEPANEGLLQYKRGWGAKERLIKYYRYDLKGRGVQGKHDRRGSFYRRILSHAPISALRFLGSVLYKHVG